MQGVLPGGVLELSKLAVSRSRFVDSSLAKTDQIALLIDLEMAEAQELAKAAELWLEDVRLTGVEAKSTETKWWQFWRSKGALSPVPAALVSNLERKMEEPNIPHSEPGQGLVTGAGKSPRAIQAGTIGEFLRSRRRCEAGPRTALSRRVLQQMSGRGTATKKSDSKTMETRARWVPSF
uniref:Uncharacterized protein n=1 Tax=Sphaerodactylus townsendi TaxID=933632 RepID=A0ACB8EW83_9SAUR